MVENLFPLQGWVGKHMDLRKSELKQNCRSLKDESSIVCRTLQTK